VARSTEERNPTQLTFVGVFSERKGIRQTMAAWDAYRADGTEAMFRIIGMGDLQSEVAGPVAVLLASLPPDAVLRPSNPPGGIRSPRAMVARTNRPVRTRADDLPVNAS